jgi:PBP1b-binding outer membrane lipoprotein LpoB
MKKIASIVAVLALGLVAVGCSEKTEATKQEEQAFRNMGNIKEPPPEAIKGMQEGLQKAAEQQAQQQQGGN